MDENQNITVFLDRDGVINYDSPEYIKSPAEWQAIPGSLEAIAKLHKAGFKLFITTNQSGVGRGLFDQATLDAIHQKMLDEIEKVGGHIEKIYFCPHKPDDHCDCRKPAPGLLQQAAKENYINLSESYVIGDSMRDITAGLAMDAKTILVMTGNGEKTAIEHKNELAETIVAENLEKAADYLLANFV